MKFQLQDAPSDLFYEIMAIANGGSGGGEGGEPSSTHTTRKQPQQQNFLEISVSKLIENVKFVHRDLFSLSSPLPSTTKGKLDLSLPIFNLLERCDEFARFLQDKFGWVVVNSSIRSDDEDEEAAMQFCNENDEGINVVSHSGIDMSRFIPATDRDEMGDVGFGRWATAGGNEDNDVDDGNDNDNDESIMECDDDDE